MTIKFRLGPAVEGLAKQAGPKPAFRVDPVWDQSRLRVEF